MGFTNMPTPPDIAGRSPLPDHVMPARVSAAFSVINHCQSVKMGVVACNGAVVFEGRDLSSYESAMQAAAIRRITQFLTGEDVSEA